MSVTYTTVKADMGWDVVLPVVNNRDVIDGIRKIPIIAWITETILNCTHIEGSSTYPIAISTLYYDLDKFLMQSPDGIFYDMSRNQFKDKEAAIQYFIEVYKEE